MRLTRVCDSRPVQTIFHRTLWVYGGASARDVLGFYLRMKLPLETPSQLAAKASWATRLMMMGGGDDNADESEEEREVACEWWCV